MSKEAVRIQQPKIINLKSKISNPKSVTYGK